jgi:hypothetical protein
VGDFLAQVRYRANSIADKTARTTKVRGFMEWLL